MPTHAITPDYHGDIKDARPNFHGNLLVYVGWDHHLLFCSSKAFPVAPTMLFVELVEQILPAAFAQHPEFESVDWNAVKWLLDGADFTPNMDKTLVEQGFGHKSLIRFQTPELKGYASAGI